MTYSTNATGSSTTRNQVETTGPVTGWWSGGEAAPDETAKGDYYMKERRDEIIGVTLRAPSSLIRQVDTIARRDGVTRSVVLRMAIESGLNAGPPRGFLRVSDDDKSKD